MTKTHNEGKSQQLRISSKNCLNFSSSKLILYTKKYCGSFMDNLVPLRICILVSPDTTEISLWQGYLSLDWKMILGTIKLWD